MTRSALRISAIGFAALSLVITLAACQERPRVSEGTPVQPIPETADASGTPAPGGNIKWNEPGSTSAAAGNTPAPNAPTTNAPAPNAPAQNPTAQKAPTPNEPVIRTPLPPGTVVPPPDSRADSGTIRWNTPQPATPSSVPGAPVGPPVNWRSGFEGDVIWVEVTDPASFYRVDRVELVAPDGRVFAARDISRTQARYDYTADSGSNVGVGAWGGSHHSGVGVGIGFPLGGRGYEREDNATRTVARFQLADPESYRRTAANWSVRVRLIDRYKQPSVARFPAPAPARY
jgi:hypothetical protein